ncbi:MAG: sugar ABC transporter ATP-binding protein [Firmicutes bacterium]|nr:sugar ABC transporter ATP-binding protein [Bacillota bacterium]
MSELLLEVKGIVKSFPGVLALNGIDFELRSGEVHAICGENGAGKSTLMKVVCGVHRQDKGTMKVNGKEAHFTNPMDAYQNKVAIIFQETSLFEEMTILDNLFLGHEMMKKVGPVSVIDYASMTRRAEEIFDRLNVKMDLQMQIKKLGMAQKQMVEIAKALTFDANIIIFDEPTASLTEREVKALFQIIRNLKSEGFGIVYISHRLEEIFEICDRVTVIRDGKYISTNDVKDMNKDLLVADMVGRKMENYYPKVDTQIGDVFFKVSHLYDNGFLYDISFELRRGEILGFAGLAGAGRTELAQCICGITKKLAGKVELEGRELQISSYREAMQEGIVYVSEDRGKYGLIVDMSVEQNITLPQLQNFTGSLGIIKKGLEDQIGEQYIKEVGIKAPDPDFLVTNLSGGNQQKVSVSKALALKPKILILDEPTRGVDVGAKAEIMKIMSDLTKQGLTIMMISSELPELIGMCDRIYVMKDGFIGGCFDREEATQESILNVALEAKKTGEG